MQEFKEFKHDEITFPRNFIKDNDAKKSVDKTGDNSVLKVYFFRKSLILYDT